MLSPKENAVCNWSYTNTSLRYHTRLCYIYLHTFLVSRENAMTQLLQVHLSCSKTMDIYIYIYISRENCWMVGLSRKNPSTTTLVELLGFPCCKIKRTITIPIHLKWRIHWCFFSHFKSYICFRLQSYMVITTNTRPLLFLGLLVGILAALLLTASNHCFLNFFFVLLAFLHIWLHERLSEKEYIISQPGQLLHTCFSVSDMVLHEWIAILSIFPSKTSLQLFNRAHSCLRNIWYAVFRPTGAPRRFFFSFGGVGKSTGCCTYPAPAKFEQKV